MYQIDSSSTPFIPPRPTPVQQACGYLLADDYVGEQPAIPDPIHRLCFGNQASLIHTNV